MWARWWIVIGLTVAACGREPALSLPDAAPDPCDDIVCGDGEVCQSGACVCATGFSYCAGVCAELAADPEHCGDCSRSCGGGGCNLGVCTGIEHGRTVFKPIALIAEGDEAAVLVESSPSASTGAVWRMTGNEPQLLISGLATPRSLAASGGLVYVTDEGAHTTWPCRDIGGVVLAAPLAGGAPFTIAIDQTCVAELAVVGEDVYWINHIDDWYPGDGELVWLAAGAATHGVLADHLEIDDLVGIDGGRVYLRIGTSSDASLFVVPLGGGVPEAVPGAAALGTAVDAGFAYWSDAGTLFRAPLSGGPGEVVAPLGPDMDARFMAFDADRVYWAQSRSSNEHCVRAVAKPGGDAVTLACDPWSIGALAVGATRVFWTSDESFDHGGRVASAAK